MNSLSSVRSLWATAMLLLACALASCSRGPELSAAAPTSASAPVRASALAPVPAPARPAPAANIRVSAPLPASPASRSTKLAVAPEITVATTAPAAPKPTIAIATATTRIATYTQAGRVLDESGQPLVGATVLLRGSTYGTSTDATGGYMLEVPKGENTFVIGYAGYKDETASSHDGQPLTVTLLPAPAASPGLSAKSRRGRR